MSDRLALEAALIRQRAKASIAPSEASTLRGCSVWAIVVTYNSAKWVESCLRGLLAQTDVGLHVLVVDNGSTDGCVDRFLEGTGSVPIEAKRLGTNTGYAVACNAGIRYAMAHGCDYAVIMNPDVEMLPGALAEMILVERSTPRAGPVAPLHVARDQERIEPGCMWFLQIGANVPREPLADDNYPRSYRLEYINGSIMLLSRSFVEKVGIFDELFFFFGEDNDLCRRAHLCGRSPVLALRGQAYHWHANYQVVDTFRTSNRRRANYLMILKKPTRPFAVSLLVTIARLALDLKSVPRRPSQWRTVLADYVHSMRKLMPAWKSRAEDRERIAATEQ